MSQLMKINGRLGALLVITMLLVAGCAQKGTPTQQEAAKNPTEVSERTLFEQNCASCHGVTGSGGTPMLQGGNIHFDEANWQKKLSDDQIKQIIKEGKNMMPAFETTFSDEELTELVKYVRSLPSQD